MGISLAETRGSTLTATIGGTAYVVPGISGATENTSEAPSTEVSLFEGSLSIRGNRPPSTITIDIGNHNVVLPVFKQLKAALRSGTSISWKFETPERDKSIPSTARVALTANDATATLSGAGASDIFKADDFGPGDGIKIGSSVYVVTEVDDSSGNPELSPTPGSTAAAAAFNVVAPGRSITFSAPLSDYAAFGTLNLDGQYSTTFTIAPSGDIPDWEVTGLAS